MLAKIEYTETNRLQTPRDNQVAKELLPEIQLQVARVNNEAVRLQALSVQLKMQDTMNRFTAVRHFWSRRGTRPGTAGPANSRGTAPRHRAAPPWPAPITPHRPLHP